MTQCSPPLMDVPIYFLCTMNGSYLFTEHSGTYGYFVKDQKVGVEVYRRKLQVAVTGK